MIKADQSATKKLIHHGIVFSCFLNFEVMLNQLGILDDHVQLYAITTMIDWELEIDFEKLDIWFTLMIVAGRNDCKNILRKALSRALERGNMRIHGYLLGLPKTGVQ